jgi:hypothetical protein
VTNRRNLNQTAVIRQVMPRDRVPGPDVLLASLDEPLPESTISKIIELHKQKIPRSKIAKRLGISKLRVTHELMKLGG